MHRERALYKCSEHLEIATKNVSSWSSAKDVFAPQMQTFWKENSSVIVSASPLPVSLTPNWVANFLKNLLLRILISGQEEIEPTKKKKKKKSSSKVIFVDDLNM